MSDRPEVFVSVDVETAGPIPGEYSLLTIGACLVDDEDRAFACRIKPVTSNAVPEALAVTGLSMAELERDGLFPRDAMGQFAAWADGLAGDSGRLVFVGFNAAFDWSFVNYYFHRYVGRNPFGFTALDIKSLYMGATGSGWHETRSSRMSSVLRPRTSGSHDALEDARHQAEMFRLVRALGVTERRRGPSDQP